MSFETDESGVETSQPREGLEIKHGTIVYRIATGSRDVTINGNVYKASPASRGEAPVATSDGGAEIRINLPVSHAFAQRYIASPPDDITVVVWRKQTGGVVERAWTGSIVSMSVARHVAGFVCKSQFAIAVDRRIPTTGCSRQCTRMLFDDRCKAPIAINRVATTVASHNGRSVVIASIGGKPDHWAKLGHLVHVPSGARMSVIDQVGTAVTLSRAIYLLRDGDAVQLLAGCAHDLATCRSKFANADNFGGLPELPRGNAWLPGGLGVNQFEPEEP